MLIRVVPPSPRAVGGTENLTATSPQVLCCDCCLAPTKPSSLLSVAAKVNQKRSRDKAEQVAQAVQPLTKRRITVFSSSSQEKITLLLTNALRRPWEWGKLYDTTVVNEHGAWVSSPLTTPDEMVRGVLRGALKVRMDVNSYGEHSDVLDLIRGYLCTISQAAVKKAWDLDKEKSVEELDKNGFFFQRCLFGVVLFV